ncbi:hypothetical protein NL868_001323 [Shigella flexneri]|nr:hypothetical protein [Shigella flexneri]
MAGKNYTVSSEFKVRVDGMVQGFNRLRQLTQQFSQQFDNAMDSSEDSIQDLAQSMNHLDFDNPTDGVQNFGHNVEQNMSRSNGAVGSFRKTLAGFAGVVAGAFAIDKIKDFGFSMVESAAESQAISAQFEQVFGKVTKDAQNTIDQLGEDFGMAPNRIKPALTTMTSMFKGLGMDTKDAMSTAENAVTLVADAAAFYDKSFEDANSALNSFIKGNYEGGEAIGLFANETQLASWASENLGISWKTLDEAGKQTARLEFAEAMQKAAGATGQAKRESDSYENQLGNLRQTWTDLKAKLGAPILTPVVSGLKGLANWIGKVPGYVDKANNAIQPLKQGFKGIVDLFKGDIKGGTDILSKLGFSPEQVQLVTFVINTLKSYVSGLLDYWSSAFSFMKTAVSSLFSFLAPYIMPILTSVFQFIGEKIAQVRQFWDENGTQIMQAVSNVFNFIKSVIEFVMPAVLFIIDMVWSNIKGVINGALGIIMSLIKIFAGLFTGDFSNMWQNIKDLFFSAVEFVWNLINLMMFGRIISGIKAFATKAGQGFMGFVAKSKEIFMNLDTILQKIVTNLVSKVLGFFRNLYTQGAQIFNTLRTFGSNVFSAFRQAVVTIVSRLASSVINFFKNIFTGAKNNFNNVLSSAKSIFGKLSEAVRHPVQTAKDLILKIFKSISLTQIGKDIIQGLLNGLNSMKDTITEKVRGLAKLIPDGVKNFLDINSPSRVMIPLGRFSAQGLAQGLEEDSHLVTEATQGLSDIVKSVDTSLNPTMSISSRFDKLSSNLNDSTNGEGGTRNNKVEFNFGGITISNKKDANDLFNFVKKGLKDIGDNL